MSGATVEVRGADRLREELSWPPAEPDERERDVLEHLLEDEWEELGPTSQGRLLEHLEAGGAGLLGRVLARCEGCGLVLLACYRPEDGRCRVCGAWLERSDPRVAWQRSGGASASASAAEPGAARVSLAEAPSAFDAAPARARHELSLEPDETDWFERLAEQARERDKAGICRRELGWLLEPAPGAAPARGGFGASARGRAAADRGVVADSASSGADARPTTGPTMWASGAGAEVARGAGVAGGAAGRAGDPRFGPAGPDGLPVIELPARAAAGAVLRFEGGKRAGEELPIGPGTIRLGTSTRNDVVVRQPGLAFKHAVLHLEADGAGSIEDLGTSEGVLVNGVSVPFKGRAAVKPGDLLRLGSLELRLAEPPPVAAPDVHAAGLALGAPVGAAVGGRALEGGSAPDAAGAAEVAGSEVGAGRVAIGAGAGRVTGLRLEHGNEAGREIELQVGTATLGTARRNEVVLRAKGVAFKHALLHLDAAGQSVLEDLASQGGTWINDVPVPTRGTAPLAAGDVVVLGQARLTVLGVAAAVAAPQSAPAPGAGAGLEGADELDPQVLLEVLPPWALELSAAVRRAKPLEDVLAAADGRDERVRRERDALDFAHLARSVIKSRLIPEPMGEWLRYDDEDEGWIVERHDPRRGTLALRCWDLLARLPKRARGTGPGRGLRALSSILAVNDEGLRPAEVEELGGGFFATSYVSQAEGEGLVGGRFDQIQLVSDGLLVAASFLPRFMIQPILRERAEDPVEEAIRAQNQRLIWRPTPASVGPPAPRVPAGGRHRGRYKPKRSGAEPGRSAPG